MADHPFETREMEGRLEAIRRWMTDHGRDGLFVTNPANVRYLAGFRGEPATLWIDAEDALLKSYNYHRILTPPLEFKEGQ